MHLHNIPYQYNVIRWKWLEIDGPVILRAVGKERFSSHFIFFLRKTSVPLSSKHKMCK